MSNSDININIVHFYNGKGGGVLSVIKNLLYFSQDNSFQNHIIIALDEKIKNYYKTPEFIGAISVKIFYYDSKWNFYYTCKKLKKLLPQHSIIIAHDWLELGMVSNMGLNNPVIQFLHGDYNYYYDLALKNSKAIDYFFAVSDRIAKNLEELLTDRSKDIFYYRFPVQKSLLKNFASKGNSIVFIGRMTTEKGYHLLPLIANQLDLIYPGVEWHIVGDNYNECQLSEKWGENIKVHFHGVISNERVNILLQESKLFILPSIAEGMPLSLIEAMKAGVVPLVNDLPGGIQELVVNEENGYLICKNDTNKYVDNIYKLLTDQILYDKFSTRCQKISSELFDPIVNILAIENQIKKLLGISKKVKKFKVYGSSLDQSWLPNCIVTTLRILKKRYG